LSRPVCFPGAREVTGSSFAARIVAGIISTQLQRDPAATAAEVHDVLARLAVHPPG